MVLVRSDGSAMLPRLARSGLDVDVSVDSTQSADGETVPYFRLSPHNAGGRACILVHGGPESVARLAWNPLAACIAAAGIEVVVPNIRGSTGFGRRWTSLDDQGRRLDVLQDVDAVWRALRQDGFAEQQIAIVGTSYGGYVSLLSLCLLPTHWGVAVSINGFSSLIKFLEGTSGYRRRYREREYGSLETDREQLWKMSPAAYIDRIQRPLLLLYGSTDSRVPPEDAIDLHSQLTARNQVCELTGIENAGHDVHRTTKAELLSDRVVGFLLKHLRHSP